MAVKVGPVAMEGMSEQNFRSQPGRADPVVFEELRALQKSSVNSHETTIWPTDLLRGSSLLTLRFHLLGLIVLGEGIDNWIEPAIHHLVELMQRQANAMIGHAILREVIGPNLFATVAGPYHTAPFGADRGLLLF